VVREGWGNPLRFLPWVLGVSVGLGAFLWFSLRGGQEGPPVPEKVKPTSRVVAIPSPVAPRSSPRSRDPESHSELQFGTPAGFVRTYPESRLKKWRDAFRNDRLCEVVALSKEETFDPPWAVGAALILSEAPGHFPRSELFSKIFVALILKPELGLELLSGEEAEPARLAKVWLRAGVRRRTPDLPREEVELRDQAIDSLPALQQTFPENGFVSLLEVMLRRDRGDSPESLLLSLERGFSAGRVQTFFSEIHLSFFEKATRSGSGFYLAVLPSNLFPQFPWHRLLDVTRFALERKGPEFAQAVVRAARQLIFPLGRDRPLPMKPLGETPEQRVGRRLVQAAWPKAYPGKPIPRELKLQEEQAASPEADSEEVAKDRFIESFARLDQSEGNECLRGPVDRIRREFREALLWNLGGAQATP
jgi:hypothetical protein